MIKLLLGLAIASGTLTVLYGVTDIPIYKYLAYIGSLAFLICAIVCAVTGVSC